MRIEVVYIACNKKDIHFARICIGSIRYWYPKLPIVLLFDLKNGTINFQEFVQQGIKINTYNRRGFGLGFIKLMPYFEVKKQRVLIIDADIVFLGKVLEKLNSHTEDVIVSPYHVDDTNDPFVKQNYFDFEFLLQKGLDLHYPGFVFNSGQLVITTDLLEQDAFNDFVSWDDPEQVMIKEDLKDHLIIGEQGIVNLVLSREAKKEKITLGKSDFYYWRGNRNVAKLDLASIRNHKGYEYLLHWAGKKMPSFRFLERSDILHFYQRHYYQRIRFGCSKRIYHNFSLYIKSVLILFLKSVRTFLWPILPGRVKVRLG